MISWSVLPLWKLITVLLQASAAAEKPLGCREFLKVVGNDVPPG